MQLDIPSLALSFGLVKLPKVEELRALRIKYDGPQINTSKIAYKDPIREAKRQERLKRDGEKIAEEKAARDARREKAIKIKEKELKQAEEERKRKRTHKGQQARMYEDWSLLAREEKVSVVIDNF